jgi:hypothetical protein
MNNDEECYYYPFVASPEVRGELENKLCVLIELVHGILTDVDADNKRRVDNNFACHKMYVRRPGD